MKIVDADQIKQVLPPKQQPAKPIGESGFDAILEKKIDHLNSDRTEPAAAPPVQPLSHLRLDPSPDRQALVSRVSEFLDIMEEYGQKLDSASSLKEISPLVSRIESETQALKRLSETLPSDDEIKTVLDEALIRSSVEIVRFNRGDYV